MDSPALSPTRHVSRRRKQRACDFCRSRKSACLVENGLPCRLCKARGRTCTFDHSVRDPGPQHHALSSPEAAEVSTPYSQPLERRHLLSDPEVAADSRPLLAESPGQPLMWDGLVSSIVPAAREPSVDALSHGRTDAEHDLRMLLFDNFADEFLMLPPGLAEATEIGQIETEASPQSIGNKAQSLPTVGSGVISSEGRAWEFTGFTADSDPYLMRYHPFDASRTWTSKRISIRSVQQAPVPMNFFLVPETLLDKVCSRSELERLVQPEIGQRLIELYFRFIFQQLPILDLKSRPTPRDSPPCLLAAIYLVAQPYADFDDHLAIQIVYDEPTRDQLREFAQRGVMAGRGCPDTSLIQTALLLGLAPPQYMLYPETQARWSLIGDAVLMAYNLGLFYDPSQWFISSEEIGLRRRLAWTLRYADTWFAAASGKQPLVAEANFMLDLPHLSDFSDEADGEYEDKDGVTGFVHVCRLTLIMVKILQNLYSARSIHELGLDLKLSLQTCRPLMDELSQWQEDMSNTWHPKGNLKIDPWGFLQLAWHFSKLMVCRALFRPFHNADSDYMVLGRDEDIEALEHLRIGARRTSTAFSNFTAQLSNRNFCAPWPFWSVTAWAAMVNMWLTLLVTARTDEEARMCKASLDRVRQVLRLQSRSFGFLRLALLRLDAVYWKGFSYMYRLSPCAERIIGEGV
ncbi:hypothetical protein GQ53DRAFT_814596 [Thozetella sp. PMI_491]|nr:hypothetical protein GQ53DRAFT_814596 [Thozetella sp. PMI_491]